MSRSAIVPRQANRREVKGDTFLPKVEIPQPDRVCRGCGRQAGRGAHLCPLCAANLTRENFAVGRKAAQRPESLAKRSGTQRAHRQAIDNWKPSGLPDWLTRNVYVNRVQPALASVPKSRICAALGVSEPYAADIRAGKRVPHPRHWQKLAGLAAQVKVSQGLAHVSKTAKSGERLILRSGFRGRPSHKKTNRSRSAEGLCTSEYPTMRPGSSSLAIPVRRILAPVQA
jgi:hypothetical protein